MKHPHRLTLSPDTGESWLAERSDVFERLLALRAEVEPGGLLLCYNGSRRDAWASGMARDMGGGYSVYLLAGVAEGERPPLAATLDPAALRGS